MRLSLENECTRPWSFSSLGSVVGNPDRRQFAESRETGVTCSLDARWVREHTENPTFQERSQVSASALVTSNDRGECERSLLRHDVEQSRCGRNGHPVSAEIFVSTAFSSRRGLKLHFDPLLPLVRNIPSWFTAR
jgi:hypothetical protein